MLFGIGSRQIAELRVSGTGLVLRTPQFYDFAEWRALRLESKAFLTPWEPVWPANDLTRLGFRRRLKKMDAEIHAGMAAPFFLFAGSTPKLVGGISITNIRRGVAQSGTIGYWMGEPHAGLGYMSHALGEVCRFGFEASNLKRLDAVCIPGNERSERLLVKNGFQKEGYLRSYLEINGVRRDHYLFAITDSDFYAGQTQDGRGRSGARLRQNDKDVVR